MEKFVFSGTSVSQVLLANAQLWGHPLLYGENTCAQRERDPVTQPRGHFGGDQSPGPPEAMGMLTRGSTGDPKAAPGTLQHTRLRQPALPQPATHPAPGMSVPSTSARTPRIRQHLPGAGAAGQVRRACGQQRALGRRRCKRPWGSPRPCPCACRWGPGGCHPSTWGGSRGPALQGKGHGNLSSHWRERLLQTSATLLLVPPTQGSVWQAVLQRTQGPPAAHLPQASGPAQAHRGTAAARSPGGAERSR